MNVLEKNDAKNHRAFGAGKALPAPRPVIRSGRTGCSMSKPELARKDTRSFAEDFCWEHSLTTVSVVLMAFPSSSESSGAATPRNHAPSNINSPNCVYVG
jgi:hypothetical protein